ncbi:MAG: hypothetical protein KJ941_06770 [Bacteroidetes bacterium]|nr:hypothetical protein [Bacteroidota bacterium]
MKYLGLFLVILSMSCLNAQTSTWSKIQEFDLPENAVWHSDVIGNLFVADKDRLTKIDTNGTKLYSQSIKSLGRISRIESINALKIILFSEEQQLIAFTDNTLTSIQGMMSLSELGFGYVTMIAASNQPNKIWVFDQINSKITLFDLSNTKQSQEVDNLRGLLKSKEITRMEERDGKLFLSDNEHQLFILDTYGSLIDLHKLGMEAQFELMDRTILLINDGRIEEYDLISRKKTQIDLPFTKFDKVQWRTPFLYVEESQVLSKYKRKLAD